MNYSWLSPANQVEHQPAIRIDYNLGNQPPPDRHVQQAVAGPRSGSVERIRSSLAGLAQLRQAPSPGGRHARIALRSTLSNSLVSEFRVGITRGERIFFGQGPDGGPETFQDTNGYAIDFDANIGLTNWHTRNTLSGRSAYQYSFDETLTWQKGKHSITYGGGAFLGRAWDDSQQQVTGINLRFDTTNDPAASMFSTANFAGASAAQLTDARELYALLTGRVGERHRPGGARSGNQPVHAQRQTPPRRQAG